MSTPQTEPLEIIVEFDKVIHPKELNALPPNFLVATLDYMCIKYVIKRVLYHGDGHSSIHTIAKNKEDYTP